MESILVLEDDDDLRDIVASVLEENDYQVGQAASAAEALELAGKQPYHLILSDVRMAGSLDGVAVIEKVKDLQPHIRSIVMTGYADLDVPIRAARVRADDYLRKPFELDELLTVVRAALDKQTPFRSLFERLSEASSDVANRARRWIFDSYLTRLNEIRELCIRRLYLLIRSGRRQASEVYPNFCWFERIELEYLKANSPVAWEKLARQYLQLEDWLLTCDQEEPPSPTVPLPLFQQLYDKIQAGRIESSHLGQAILLLHDPEARKRDVESYSTYHWLWSEPLQERDVFEGLKLGEYVLERRRSSHNQNARLYDAVVEGQKSQGDVVLCLPANQESAGFVKQELESGRCRLLKEARAHLFLLYPGDTLSLAHRIPPQGYPPAQAWALLRPVFQQVYLQHQQGVCSGSFDLKDIEWVAGQPARLVQFDPEAFRVQARDIQAGRLVGGLHTAPEAASQSDPTPLSDQFVLGQILFRVAMGQAAREFPATYFHSLESEGVKTVWNKMAPRLGPLGPIIHRLCQREPERRYKDLRQAAQALDEALSVPQIFNI